MSHLDSSYYFFSLNVLKLAPVCFCLSLFPKAWGISDKQRRRWNLSTLFFVHACSWKTLIRIFCTKCQNPCSSALWWCRWFRFIVHWAWWSVMRVRSLSLMRQGPETGQPDGARGYLRVEKFCSVPPFAGMNASGASEYHYWEMVGADHFVFLLTRLVVCFRPHRCKVRETFNSTKIRQLPSVLPVVGFFFVSPISGST